MKQSHYFQVLDSLVYFKEQRFWHFAFASFLTSSFSEPRRCQFLQPPTTSLENYHDGLYFPSLSFGAWTSFSVLTSWRCTWICCSLSGKSSYHVALVVGDLLLSTGSASAMILERRLSGRWSALVVYLVGSMGGWSVGGSGAWGPPYGRASASWDQYRWNRSPAADDQLHLGIRQFWNGWMYSYSRRASPHRRRLWSLDLRWGQFH